MSRESFQIRTAQDMKDALELCLPRWKREWEPDSLRYELLHLRDNAERIRDGLYPLYYDAGVVNIVSGHVKNASTRAIPPF